MQKISVQGSVQGSVQTSSSFEQQARQALTAFQMRRDIGFPQIPERESLWTQSEKMGLELRQKFQNLVVVGLGGSSMGARSLNEIFQKPTSPHKIIICDNVDELEFSRLLASPDFLPKTAWLVISKSGSTIETMMTLDLILQKYEQTTKLNWKSHIFVITEPKDNPLSLFARKNELQVAEIPLDVGGRFSALTPVGMVPAAFLGLNLQKFREGSRIALNHSALVPTVAAVLESYSHKKDITLFWSYSSHLREFGGWINQLWAESLGKAVDRNGQPAPSASTPVALVGACDQHSVLQQVMEGPKNKFIIFQRVQSAEARTHILRKSHFPEFQFLEGRTLGELLAAEAVATSEALTQVGVSNLTLSLEDLSEHSVGELLMFWQMVVAVLGEALNIDAFNQPGVELGKRLARKILQSY